VSDRLRAVAWTKDDPPGMEFTEVRLSTSALRATGVAISSEPVPYRLDYFLFTDWDFVTAALRVDVIDDNHHKRLELRQLPEGRWQVNGEERRELDEALDCDLGLSPLTNSMPVLRHGLLEASEPVELLTAWVSVPDLTVHASRQRYTGLGGRLVRFESLDDTFTADISFDEDGLVVDYPGTARRLSGSSGG
jgi:uncharacterized protein